MHGDLKVTDIRPTIREEMALYFVQTSENFCHCFWMNLCIQTKINKLHIYHITMLFIY